MTRWRHFFSLRCFFFLLHNSLVLPAAIQIVLCVWNESSEYRWKYVWWIQYTLISSMPHHTYIHGPTIYIKLILYMETAVSYVYLPACLTPIVFVYPLHSHCIILYVVYTFFLFSLDSGPSYLFATVATVVEFRRRQYVPSNRFYQSHRIFNSTSMHVYGSYTWSVYN